MGAPSHPPRLPPAPAALLATVLAAVLAALLAGGCQASLGLSGSDEQPKTDIWGRPLEQPTDGPQAPSFEPVVLERKDPAGEADLRERRALPEEQAGWAEKLETARALLAAGSDAEALAMVEAALDSEPPAEVAGRLRAMRLEARARRAGDEVLRVEARAPRDVVGFGRDVEFVLRLRNMGRSDIVFGGPPAASAAPVSPISPSARGGALRGPAPAAEAPASASALVLEVLRRDRDVAAALLERRWTATVPLQRPGDPPLRLAPGEQREFPVRIPAQDVGPPLLGVRVLELGGLLRPSQVSVEGGLDLAALRVRPGRVAVLPEGHEALAADPLRSLEQAVALRAAPHVLVACEFLPRAQAGAAAALLARALVEGDALLATAAEGALGLLRERCVGDPLALLVDPLVASLEARPGRARELLLGLMATCDARLPADGRLWVDWWRRTRPTRPVVTALGSSPTR
ncbi:MAG: hypothetical protein ACKOSS_06560 [Planctomycetia bacterium]